MFYEQIWEYEGHTLVRRPDTPNYYIYWRTPGTRRTQRRSTGTRHLEEAKRRLIEHVEYRGRRVPRKPHEVPILDTLIDYADRDGPADFRRYAVPASIKHLVHYIELADIQYVSDLTLDAQQGYIEWRRTQLQNAGFTGSNGTLRRELGVLKAALRWAWKRQRLESVPHICTVPCPPPRQRYLTADESRRLLAASAAVEHLELYVMLSLHTLQRPKAILDLRREQIDLIHGRIDFHPPDAIEHNKRRPVVPITPTLHGRLEEAVVASRSGWIVEYHGRPLKGIRAAFNSARDRAGLDAGVTPYTLRHTGATLLAANGVPMRQISGMLGHSHSRTTEMYAKHAPEYLSDARDTLDRLFATSG